MIGSSHHTGSVTRSVERSLNRECDLYKGGGDDGRGGQTAPSLVTKDVSCYVQPLTGEKATQYLGERITYQDPKMFIFTPDTTLPDVCYALYNGTLYREEKRQQTAVMQGVVMVEADDQSIA